jgi:hypothetical protein
MGEKKKLLRAPFGLKQYFSHPTYLFTLSQDSPRKHETGIVKSSDPASNFNQSIYLANQEQVLPCAIAFANLKYSSEQNY